MLTPRQFAMAIPRRLREARDIEVVKREGWWHLGTSSRDVFARRLKRHLGRPLSPVMLKRLTYPTNGRLYWQYPRGDVDLPHSECFSGEICLYNLGLSLVEKDFSHIDFKESPDLEFLEPCRILDEHPSIGDGQMTLVRLNDEGTDVELFFLSRWTLYPLALSFEEYHWCQTVTLGYANWPLLFCPDLPASDRRSMRTSFRTEMARNLNKIWPGTDLGELFALADRGR
jgi:hypothetical protein